GAGSWRTKQQRPTRGELVDRATLHAAADLKNAGVNVQPVQVQRGPRRDQQRINVERFGSGSGRVVRQIDELNRRSSGEFERAVGKVLVETGRRRAQILAHDLQSVRAGKLHDPLWLEQVGTGGSPQQIAV